MQVSNLEQIADAFDLQITWCKQMGSPFTSRVLAALVQDIRSGGRVADLLTDFSEEPIAAALALRVAGACHRRALDDPQSRLGDLYSVASAAPDDRGLQSVLLEDIAQNRSHYEAYLEGPPQTNEAARSGVLMGGYLTIAAETGLCLDIAEIGASAGLNLAFDQYSYDLGGLKTGALGSRVHICPKWRGEQPADAELTVRKREACDIAPLDVRDHLTRQRLLSYIWADQIERLDRLRGAMEIARECDLKIEALSADVFIKRVLAERVPNGVLVISHSNMWHYLPVAMRSHIQQMIEAAGTKAPRSAPLAWLRFEGLDEKSLPMLSLTLWDGNEHTGQRRDLATGHPHGTEIQWF